MWKSKNILCNAVLKIGVVLFVSVLSFPSSNALATGYSKSVTIGPKAIGMGGAFVGIADDPTAVYHNPAGITQIEGQAIEAGFDGLATDLDYTTPAANVEKADLEFLPVPRIHYVNSIFSPISFGLGIYFPHGNGGHFPGPSVVATNPTEGRIYSMEIAPTFAWKAAEWLSIGAGLRIVRIQSSLKGQLVPLSPTQIVSIDDLEVKGWTVGAAAGILVRPNRWISFGANYRSKLSKTLDGEVDISSTLGTATDLNVSIKQVLPTLVTAGFGSNPIDGLTLGLAYSFERNSEIKNVSGTVETLGAITLPQNWDDSHTIHVGGEYYVLPKKLAVRAGYAKDLNRSIPDSVINRVIGDIASHEVSAGLGYHWKQFFLQGTWNGRFGERNVPNNGTNVAPGKYEAFVHSFSFGLGMDI